MRLQKVAARHQVELNWAQYEAARANLYPGSVRCRSSDYDILQVMRDIVDSYYKFIKALGAQEHAEQMTWELLQSEHSLFYATSATIYDDCCADPSVSTK